MSQVLDKPAEPVGDELPPLPRPPEDRPLLRELLVLAFPVLAEHALHILVGLTDTYLANHLPVQKAEAAAAVGTVGYIFWFLGLFASP